MTQPIQEPGSTTRTDAKLTWGSNQLFRRPFPPPESTTSAYMDDFSWNGTGATIADDTWVPLVTGFNGANDRWLDQSCVDPDPDAGWGISYPNGAISNGGNYNFSAWGFIAYDVPDGTIIGCQVSFTGQENHANTGPVVDGLARIICSVENTPLNSDARLWAYQASGAPADITDARIVVRRFEAFSGYDCQFAS